MSRVQIGARASPDERWAALAKVRLMDRSGLRGADKRFFLEVKSLPVLENTP